jgi:capsular exopolysaccharide synthesis family protein
MKAGQSSQPPSLANVAQFNESDEGGLDLGQVLGAIRRRILLVFGVTVVVASAAVLKDLNDVPVYQAKFEILTQPVTAEGEVVSSLPQTLTSRQDQSATAQVNETTIRLLQSPELLTPVVGQLKARYPDISYEALVGNLSIATEGANILTVAYQHPNPKLVSDVLDLLAKAYLKYSLEERQTDIRQGLKFVEEQLPELRARVQIQQEQLQKLRQRHNLVEPVQTGEQLSSQISTFEQQRLDTQLQLEEARSLSSNLQEELAQSSAESAAATVLSENPRYQRILDGLQATDTAMAKESVLFREDSPTMEILREQRQNLLPLLRQEGQRVEDEMVSRIQALEARDRALEGALERLTLQVKQLSVISRDYTNIQRELQIATDNLNQFLAKREALRIEVAQRELPWQLLAPRNEPQAVAASPKKNLLLGTGVGLLLGVGVALIADKLGNVIYTSKAVKEVAKLPLLGVIPSEKKLSEEFVPTVNVTAFMQQADSNLEFKDSERQQQQRTPLFMEVFRSLYTNIRLLNADTPIGSLIVSSATQGEGKSTVAMYLAQAAAVMGRRVLLVDTNLRYPSLQKRFGAIGFQGLTDIIATDVAFEDVIERSPLEDNLFVLTAGSIPPDPIRLLASQTMQDLMANLQAAFDLVIYDAPPLVGIADAYLLATQTNGIVLVTGLGKLKRSVLEQALEGLKVAGTPVLGVVANKAKDPPPSSYSYQRRSYAPESILSKFGRPYFGSENAK